MPLEFQELINIYCLINTSSILHNKLRGDFFNRAFDTKINKWFFTLFSVF